jgi:hypothetical protein
VHPVTASQFAPTGCCARASGADPATNARDKPRKTPCGAGGLDAQRSCAPPSGTMWAGRSHLLRFQDKCVRLKLTRPIAPPNKRFSWLWVTSVSWASLVPPGGLSLSKSAAGIPSATLRGRCPIQDDIASRWLALPKDEILLHRKPDKPNWINQWKF